MISLIEFQRACEAQAAISIVPTALREVCAANARIVGEWRERLIEIVSLLAADNRGVEREAAAQATRRLLALAGAEYQDDDGEEG
jgi:hypothetical protein